MDAPDPSEDVELLHDEHVVWRGAPGMRTTSAEIFWFVFGLFWVALFLLPIGLAASNPTSSPEGPGDQASVGAVLVFVLVWLSLIAAGVFFMVGPYLIRRSWTRRTGYLLTDRRAISITTGRHRTVHAEFLSNVAALNKKVHSDGSGSIAFGNVRSWSVPPGGMGFPYTAWHIAFVLMFWEIADVEHVYALADRYRRERLRDS